MIIHNKPAIIIPMKTNWRPLTISIISCFSTICFSPLVAAVPVPVFQCRRSVDRIHYTATVAAEQKNATSPTSSR